MNFARQKCEELSVGQELTTFYGIFKVSECIAMGRCCEVYQGEQKSSKKCIAIKVFRRYQDYRGALQRELLFLKKLSNQDAPVVNHHGEMMWEGRDILLQELLTCTLRDIFLSIDDGLCSSWLLITLANDIFRGLSYIHKNGIVHADLKPLNLMWDAKTSTFKFIDFGLSFRTAEHYTHAIQSKGYQAPECMKWNSLTVAQRSKAQQIPGPAADIWSAACIIAEAITGHQFSYCDGENIEETVKARINATSFSYSGPFIVEAQRFLIRCLQIPPGRRPTADDLLDEPWLKQYHQPPFSDTVLLPTTVIRILNVDDPGNTDSSISKDVGCRILNLCKKYGEIRGSHFETSLGHFYVWYQEPTEAEVAQQSLSESLVNDRKLIVTFYSLSSWLRQDFY